MTNLGLIWDKYEIRAQPLTWFGVVQALGQPFCDSAESLTPELCVYSHLCRLSSWLCWAKPWQSNLETWFFHGLLCLLFLFSLSLSIISPSISLSPQRCQIRVQSGSDWAQIGQIRVFFKDHISVHNLVSPGQNKNTNIWSEIVPYLSRLWAIWPTSGIPVSLFPSLFLSFFLFFLCEISLTSFSLFLFVSHHEKEVNSPWLPYN